MLQQVNDRILALNAIDKRYKTKYETFASLMEEAGEFATELKIYQGTFGNAHKVSEEGPKAELVDFYICVLCWFDWKNPNESGYKQDLMTIINNFSYKVSVIDNIFLVYYDIITYITGGIFYGLFSTIFNIFINYLHGTPEEFIEIANRKLDKWEASQKRSIQ